MTLGSCPDCEHPVSFNAKACPNCGCHFQQDAESNDEVWNSENGLAVFFAVLIGCIVLYTVVSDLNFVVADRGNIDGIKAINVMFRGFEVQPEGTYVDMKTLLIQVKDTYYGVAFGDDPSIDIPIFQNHFAAFFAKIPKIRVLKRSDNCSAFGQQHEKWVRNGSESVQI